MIPTAIVTLSFALTLRQGLNVYSTSLLSSSRNSGLYNIVDSIEKRIVVKIVSKQAYRHVNSLRIDSDLSSTINPQS